MKAALARLERPPKIPPTLPLPLIRLLRMMTAVKPNRRPSAQRCVEVLHALLQDMMNTQEHRTKVPRVLSTNQLGVLATVPLRLPAAAD
jgi:hypothetical protein